MEKMEKMVMMDNQVVMVMMVNQEKEVWQETQVCGSLVTLLQLHHQDILVLMEGQFLNGLTQVPYFLIVTMILVLQWLHGCKVSMLEILFTSENTFLILPITYIIELHLDQHIMALATTL